MRILETAQAVSKGDERPNMQDVAVIAPPTHGSRYMGVFDGHGSHGLEIAERGAAVLLEVARFQEDIHSATAGAVNVCGALRTLHDQLKDEHIGYGSGTTATVGVFKDSLLSVVQIGDSGAVYIPTEGETAILTRPHDTTNENEIERVKNLDPPVALIEREYALRFAGNMMISRAIGDHSERYILGIPEVSNIILERSGILLLGTDGALGGTPERAKLAGTYVQACEREGYPLEQTAQEVATVFANSHLDNAGVVLARIG